MKNQKGISLVALIVTIIVMVILAAVIIISTVADGGVIDRAESAMKEKERAEAEELVMSSYVYKTMASTTSTTALLNLEETADAIYENLTSNGFTLMNGNTEASSGTNILNGHVINLNIVGKHGNYEGTVTEKGLEGGLKIVEEGDTTGLKGAESETAKYFNFTIDEESKTAVLTGIKEEYYTESFYKDQTYRYPTAINDNGNYITEITLPEYVLKDDIAYEVTEIGEKALAVEDYEYGATADAWFTNITIPNTVTKIGMGAFGGCQGLTNITIPESVDTIGDYAFYYSGLETLTLPDTITNIGKYIIESCNNISSVYSKSLKTLSWSHETWADDESGHNEQPIIYTPQESFDYQNFNSKAKQEYFTYTLDETNKTATITGISENYVEKTFYNNRDHIICIKDGESYVTDIIIPSEITNDGEIYTVVSIGENVFLNRDSRGNKSKFTSVFIPKTITSIALDAFDGCSLYKVYCEKTSLSGLGEEWLADLGYREGFYSKYIDLTNLYLIGQ